MSKADFPKWMPTYKAVGKFSSMYYKTRIKALRQSSSGFIKRTDVREYIFLHKGRMCYLCGGTDELQIDHIVSVHQYAKKQYPYEGLNSYENLAPICKKCNCSKAP